MASAAGVEGWREGELPEWGGGKPDFRKVSSPKRERIRENPTVKSCPMGSFSLCLGQ